MIREKICNNLSQNYTRKISKIQWKKMMKRGKVLDRILVSHEYTKLAALWKISLPSGAEKINLRGSMKESKVLNWSTCHLSHESALVKLSAGAHSRNCVDIIIYAQNVVVLSF